MGAVQRLTISMEAVAALGAQLRVETESIDVDPRVGPLLAESAGLDSVREVAKTWAVPVRLVVGRRP
jgi:hypothetical protein